MIVYHYYPTERRMLTVKQAAFYCNVSVEKFEAENLVSPVMVMGKLLYDKRDLDEMLNGNTSYSPQHTHKELLKRYEKNT